jgi:hypothetical protein
MATDLNAIFSKTLLDKLREQGVLFNSFNSSQDIGGLVAAIEVDYEALIGQKNGCIDLSAQEKNIEDMDALARDLLDSVEFISFELFNHSTVPNVFYLESIDGDVEIWDVFKDSKGEKLVREIQYLQELQYPQ